MSINCAVKRLPSWAIISIDMDHGDTVSEFLRCARTRSEFMCIRVFAIFMRAWWWASNLTLSSPRANLHSHGILTVQLGKTSGTIKLPEASLLVSACVLSWSQWKDSGPTTRLFYCTVALEHEKCFKSYSSSIKWSRKRSHWWAVKHLKHRQTLKWQEMFLVLIALH